MNTTMIVAVTEARDACRGESDLKERVRRAMRVTADHWLVTGYEDWFKSALAAAMMESFDDERAKLQALAKLSALIHASSVGVHAELRDGDLPEPGDVIGLRGLWLEIAGSPR